MSALGRKLRKLEGGLLAFWCPGCKQAHQVKVEGPHAWGLNQCTDAITFSPSILVRGVERLTDEQHKALMEGSPKNFEPKPLVCHSFVREGRIEFLGDCTHQLAGKTLPLPDFPSNMA